MDPLKIERPPHWDKPRKPRRPERVMLGLRVTPEVKQRLDTVAKANGRSLSQEAEYRLEKTFWLEDLMKARLLVVRIPANKTDMK